MIALSKKNTIAFDRKVFIPPQITNAIKVHCMRNFCEHHGSPLILTLHGAAGMGKTFALQVVLADLNVRIFRMSASDFEDIDAGQPGKTLAEHYRAASTQIEGKQSLPSLKTQNKGSARRPACIVVDDVDLAIGRFDDTTSYTVNTQILCNLLMQLADRPNELNGVPCRRVPIFFTGNDLGKLYPPLLRPGRMELLNFELNEHDKANIVTRIFPSLSLDEARNLINSFPGEPIAFFADISHRLDDDLIRRSIAQYKSAEAIQFAVDGRIKLPSHKDASYGDILDVASFLFESRVIKNHLEA